MNCHDKRQVQATAPPIVPLPVSSTSSFDWWPYHSTTTSELLPTSNEVDPDDDEAPETLTSTSSISPSDGSADSPSTQTNVSESFLSAAPSESDSTATSALITITALPPLTSPVKHSHRISAYRQPTNLTLFAPVLGILGLGFGLAFGWYAYGYWKRRQDAQDEKRVAGPRYKGINVIDVDDQKDPEKREPEEADDTCHGDLLSEQPFLCKENGDIPVDAEYFCESARPGLGSSWSHTSLSMPHGSSLLSGLLGGHRDLIPAQDKQKGNKLRNTILSPDAPTVFNSVASSDDDEDYEDARRLLNGRGTAHHKSIRRRIAEKLRLRFNSGRAMTRKGSRKPRKARGTTPELEEGALMQDNSLIEDSPKKASLRRARTRPVNSVLGHGRAISDFSVAPDAVQIPPKVYELKDPGVSSPSKDRAEVDRSYMTLLKSVNESGVDDKYTPLPERKVRKLVSARSTRRRIEILEDSEGLAKFNLSEDADRRILPTSPPLLSSSELESALFFGPGDSSSGPSQRMSRFGQFNRDEYDPGATSGYDQASSNLESPSRRVPLGPRTSRKLVSKHSPGNGMNVSAANGQPLRAIMTSTPLRRSTARASSCSPSKRGYGSGCSRTGRDRSSTLPSVPMSPRERYEARQGAFDKVDAIVERSWSARLLQSPQAVPGPPPVFGEPGR